MNTLAVEYPVLFPDYELIDSGDGKKLERFASYTVSRPDPRAVWKPQAPQSLWDGADAIFTRTDKEHGEWNVKTPAPDPWTLRYADLSFILRPTDFKHVGLFPEQSVNWTWLGKTIAGRPLHVLNLFGYTGAASCVMAASGARVTHVDSSKSTVFWASENARINKLESKGIRWIVEDAFKFVSREAKRGHTYDGIVMDPPRFGHGAKGEIWKLEDDLPGFLEAVHAILSPGFSFVLINAYTADLSSIALGNLASGIFGNGSMEAGELTVKESHSGRLVPHGIFARVCGNP